MLAQVRIHNLALIEDATLDFGPGLNVLTGETGAGKSIVVEGLGLLFGWRADSSKVRAGCKEALVEGRFELAEPLEAQDTPLAELLDGATEIVVTRRLSAEGKSRCLINGYMAPVAHLSELGGLLVEVHGQHENQSLLRPRVHLELLDRYGGPELVALRQRFGAELARLREIEGQLREIERRRQDETERASLLRFQVGEIERGRVEPGEDEVLERERQSLRHHAKLVAALESADGALAGTEDSAAGAADLAFEAAESVRSVADLLATGADLVERIAGAAAELQEGRGQVRRQLDELRFDPQRLAAIEERLFHLADLKKKYGPTLDEVVRYAEKAGEDLNTLDDSAGRLEEYRLEAERIVHSLGELGRELRLRRQRAATAFDKSVASQLRELAMDDASFQTRLVDVERPEATGLDQAAFLISANHGEAPQPLTKIASGGEISRVMLALRTTLAAVDRIPIMIFDEIDSGIGGRTAVAVGQKLAELARARQVICVTHWPQIAAFGDHHFAVSKAARADRTVTQVRQLSEAEKIAEMARLAGSAGGVSAAHHARDLLDEARSHKANVGTSKRTEKQAGSARARQPEKASATKD